MKLAVHGRSSKRNDSDLKITQIRKRDGRVVPFDEEKITNAIYKAIAATGGRDRTLTESLSRRVVEILDEKYGANIIPAVEDVQDVVERALVENGQARVAKAYIIYRQERAEIRSEKQKVLEKDAIDEVDKAFDLNALRVLKARYLKKDETGKLIETPKQLFTRIAVHAALPDLLYDAEVYDITKKQPSHPDENFDPEQFHEKVSIGKYPLNRYHLQALKRMYDRFNRKGEAKMSWNTFFDGLKSGRFNGVERSINAFYELMVTRKFMPNTPAIANFGNVLGMGSACFHPRQLVMTEAGLKQIKDIKVGDAVLTHRGRFMNVTQVFVRTAPSLYTVSCRKLPKPAMKLTAEHPILAYKDGKVEWRAIGELSAGDYIALTYLKDVADVEQITVSDNVGGVAINKNNECFYTYTGGKYSAFRHTTNPIRNTVRVDRDLMKLFGFYLAEGSIEEEHAVRFTFGSDEERYCDEVISIMRNKFGITARIERTNTGQWLTVRFHSTILAKFFRNILGNGYNRKQIPSWIMRLPQEKQKALMSGMIRGDGTVFKNGNKTHARLVMCNSDLVYSFWQMAMRCGVFAALGKETMPALGIAQPYRCTISGKDGLALINEMYGMQETDDGFIPGDLSINGTFFTRIDEITKTTYGGLVYNLEVERDHSYAANMISAHNCFVLGVEDSIESIMETLKQTAVVFKAGGGMGYNFSKLRPEGDYVSSTSGVASGPISFMMLFDTMTDVIKQGGIRRGANMGILNSNHPDVEKFITAKKGNKALRNFNISVLIMPEFWESYRTNKPYPLVNPRTGQIVREVNARLLFDMIVYQAWESAEPGVIFYDHVNEYNPFLKHLGPIVTTNPCGEVLLYPNESCNLGSINVWAFMKRDENGRAMYDWDGLREAVSLGTRFLDNVIDVNNFPLKPIEDMTLATRKIGLGVMGLADLLLELRLPYNSDEGRKIMEELMEFINYHSKLASIELAKERGPLPYFDGSFYPEGKLPFSAFHDRKSWHFEWDKVAEMIKEHGVRNGYTTVIAPTGSISMIAGCSSGIEPVYSLVFEKHVKVGSFYYIDPVFERVMTDEGLFGDDLLRDVNEHGGSIQRITYIPEDLKRVYVTAMDIRPEDHIRALAAFQRWTDSSISKTNNFPANATVEAMRESYLLAYKLGCKDVTVFRDTSIKGQVLVAPRKKNETTQNELKTEKERGVTAPKILAMPLVGTSQGVGEQLKVCPQCSSQVVYQEGCYICPECGWGACS